MTVAVDPLSLPHTFTMTIDGEPVAGEAGFDVVDPATGEVFAQAPDCSSAQLDAAFAAARRAQPAWARDETARVESLRAVGARLREHASTIATLMVREQGKPLEGARREVELAAAWFDHYAALELPVEVVADRDLERIEKVHRPLGVVAAIAPWNAPIMLAVWKLAPALRAGNTVVLKPSPFTPLSTLAAGEALRDVLPPGVLNVVTGRDPLGALMVAHPVPRKVSFTGSTATGAAVAASAAGDLKRVTLELGGNDPAIVLGDVDPAAIADRLYAAAFINSGQICLAVKRVYAHADVYDAVVEELARRARAAVLGNGLDPATTLGPLSTEPQLRRVVDLVDDALARGAVAAAGGEAAVGGGYFYRPTVLRDAVDGMAVVDEEQFGPVLPVVSFDHVDAVVDRVNDSPFGLTASVWSADVDAAAEVAARIDAGQVTVNGHMTGLRPSLPFSGHKHSGVGIENGLEGLLEYTSTTVLIRPKG
jgi:acyl-CoA reductase-like NAD-dependent aldehyde dehydrogenase